MTGIWMKDLALVTVGGAGLSINVCASYVTGLGKSGWIAFVNQLYPNSTANCNISRQSPSPATAKSTFVLNRQKPLNCNNASLYASLNTMIFAVRNNDFIVLALLLECRAALLKIY